MSLCTALERDDAFIEYVTLQNLTGNYEKAYELLCFRKLHPWEGGEGKAAAQYITALTEMAKEKIRGKDYRQAKGLLSRALIYFGEQHLRDEVKIDYFAVSLPDPAQGMRRINFRYFLVKTGNSSILNVEACLKTNNSPEL